MACPCVRIVLCGIALFAALSACPEVCAMNSSPPTTTATTLPSGFDDAAINARINTLRKADIALRILDGDGRPFTGTVRYRLVKHSFEFGTALSARALGVDANPMPDKDVARYKETVSAYFSAAVAENAMKWYAMDDLAGQKKVEPGLSIWKWCDENDIRMRGHCVWWGVAKYASWTAQIPADQLRQRMLDRATHMVDTYRGRIQEWDLCNEMMHQDIFAAAMKINQAEYFHWVRKAAGEGWTFYVNEYGVLQGGEIDRYVAHIRRLLDNGAVVGGIGDQAHFFKRLPRDEELWAILDKLGQFGLPVKITEFDLQAPDMTEQQQADDYRRFLRLCFSHPAVHGFYFWGFWEGAHWRPAAAMWRRDWTIKPNGQAVVDLLTRDWTTADEAIVRDGRLAFRGFPGVYRVTGGNGTARVRLIGADAGDVKLLPSQEPRPGL